MADRTAPRSSSPGWARSRRWATAHPRAGNRSAPAGAASPRSRTSTPRASRCASPARSRASTRPRSSAPRRLAGARRTCTSPWPPHARRCCDSGLDIAAESTEVGVLIASGIGGLEVIENTTRVLDAEGARRVSPFAAAMALVDMAPGMVSIDLGARGPNMAVVSACASGADAIGQAANWIRQGDAVAVLAGGTEAGITSTGIAMFAAARALSTRNDDPEHASRPFERDRDGFVAAEGSAVLVLEEREHALAQGRDHSRASCSAMRRRRTRTTSPRRSRVATAPSAACVARSSAPGCGRRTSSTSTRTAPGRHSTISPRRARSRRCSVNLPTLSRSRRPSR